MTTKIIVKKRGRKRIGVRENAKERQRHRTGVSWGGEREREREAKEKDERKIN